MDTKMNEEQYRKMISLDIEFLKQLPDSLERKHIISILKESVEMYYSSDGNTNNSENANCAIFDVMPILRNVLKILEVDFDKQTDEKS
jgi:hypothetical protein